jgi:hypothetical protein
MTSNFNEIKNVNKLKERDVDLLDPQHVAYKNKFFRAGVQLGNSAPVVISKIIVKISLTLVFTTITSIIVFTTANAMLPYTLPYASSVIEKLAIFLPMVRPLVAQTKVSLLQHWKNNSLAFVYQLPSTLAHIGLVQLVTKLFVRQVSGFMPGPILAICIYIEKFVSRRE